MKIINEVLWELLSFNFYIYEVLKPVRCTAGLSGVEVIHSLSIIVDVSVLLDVAVSISEFVSWVNI